MTSTTKAAALMAPERVDCADITDRATRMLALAALGDGAIDEMDAIFIDENPARANEVAAFVAWLAEG